MYRLYPEEEIELAIPLVADGFERWSAEDCGCPGRVFPEPAFWADVCTATVAASALTKDVSSVMEASVEWMLS